MNAYFVVAFPGQLYTRTGHLWEPVNTLCNRRPKRSAERVQAVPNGRLNLEEAIANGAEKKRTIVIAKDNSLFTPAPHVESQARNVFEGLAADQHLPGLARSLSQWRSSSYDRD